MKSRTAILCTAVSSMIVACSSVDDGRTAPTATSKQAFSASDFTVTHIPIPYPLVPNFGSLSGLAYDESNDTWWTHDDNRSGTVTYPTLFNFRVTSGGVQVLQSMPLRDEAGNNVVASPSSTTQSVVSAGLDPEDIEVAPDGTLWMIEEENETILHVSRQGQIMARYWAPGFRGSFSPNAAAGPVTRVRGAGFEGLTISPDGNTIYAGHQTAQLTFPAGEADVTFIAALHVPTNTWRVYKVPLDSPSAYVYPAGTTGVRMGMHALQFAGYDAQGREQIAYIERDNKRDDAARDKRIYRVTLPDYATYDNTPLPKDLDVDLVALGYKLEKPEGLQIRGNRYYIVNDNVQTVGDPMEFTIVQRLVPPTVACVGSPTAPAVIPADAGTCSAVVSSADGRAGTCSGGGDGLASCTLNGADPTTLAVGNQSVAVVGTANDGSSASCTSYVAVVDEQAPTISVSASPSTLWPPNHKMTEIALATSASDACGAPTVSCTGSSSEEGGDDDIQWADGKLFLRAERDGNGADRIYTITCTATDASGNSTSSSTTVTVPHDQ